MSVSNHVTNDGGDLNPPSITPPTFSSPAPDPDAFRIEIEDPNAGPTVDVTITVGRRASVTYTAHLASGAKRRGPFLRLVTDGPDDAINGDLTLLCAVEETVWLRHAGQSCVDYHSIKICRPREENNNSTDQSLHDVRKLRLNVVVFSRPGTRALDGAITATATTIKVDSVANAHTSGFVQIDSEFIQYTSVDSVNNLLLNCTRGVEGTTAAAHADQAPVRGSRTAPTVTRFEVDSDLATIDERFAQAGIRLRRPVPIDMGGVGDPGVPMRPQFLSGFRAANENPLVNPTADEQALVAHHKDAAAYTIDMFYVEDLQFVGGGQLNALAYYPSANGTGDTAYQNFFIVSANRYATLDLPHEIMHILTNSDHRPGELPTALLHEDSVIGKPVAGPKRIGPYPDANTSGVGTTDTFDIRSIVEALHQ